MPYDDKLATLISDEHFKELLPRGMIAQLDYLRRVGNNATHSRQMHFVQQIVNYIVKNGMMKDLSVLQGSPFTDSGSISELFEDVKLFGELRSAIEKIGDNARVA